MLGYPKTKANVCYSKNIKIIMSSADFGIVEVKGPEAAVMKSCHVT